MAGKRIRAAVIGVGYLGRFHAQKYQQHSGVDLVGVVDSNAERAKEVAAEVGTQAYSSYADLQDKVDIVSIAVPTHLHHAVARQCLQAGCHILLEKPVTKTLAEADELIKLADERGLVFQVGHLERFNPAVLALKGVLKEPMFIESHRMAAFKTRGTDINVVLDLMIHDIDILLSMVGYPLKTITPIGVPVLSGKIDIANARLQFANGCVADVTASRVSLTPMRKIRIFQQDAYISIDYLKRKIAIFRKNPGSNMIPGLPNISLEERSFEQRDALKDEIDSFVASVCNGTPQVVTGEDGRRALAVALEISSKIRQVVKEYEKRQLIDPDPFPG
ncbi:MAG: Gfo/Idh/MocA family oxidoreductase [Deltaproteobacteria bacterium]|jgi:predicted dehydrogenase|nr:Gfo/Idh/MocA family oxidoreductase [Deltaproteobacteria bacterium]